MMLHYKAYWHHLKTSEEYETEFETEFEEKTNKTKHFYDM